MQLPGSAEGCGCMEESCGCQEDCGCSETPCGCQEDCGCSETPCSCQEGCGCPNACCPCEPCQRQCQGGQSQTEGDLSETQGDQIEIQGGQSERQGDQSQSQGNLEEVQGDQTQSQGDQSQSQGNLGETQGDQTQNQGDQSQTQGNLGETQGDQTQSQGDQAQEQGALSQTQGDQTESLGDLSQTQGGETQGDQYQLLTGHGGQTQGDQYQLLTGHGGQTQGDQSLVSAPSISTPVTVSGVNLYVTVDCAKERQCCDCSPCLPAVYRLLCLIRFLLLSVRAQENAVIEFYGVSRRDFPVTGTLEDLIRECLFAVRPLSGSDSIFIATEKLEMMAFTGTKAQNSLFLRLLQYLQQEEGPEPAEYSGQGVFNCDACDSGVCGSSCGGACGCACGSGDIRSGGRYCGAASCCCDPCAALILNLLRPFIGQPVRVELGTDGSRAEGFVYRLRQEIIYLTDDPEKPEKIYAVPAGKIRSFRPENTELETENGRDCSD